jgi:hypothetical protein
VTCNLAIGCESHAYRGRLLATVETVLLRIGVGMEMLHSNGHFQIGTVAGGLSMFATCGRFPWKAPTSSLCNIKTKSNISFPELRLFT